MEHDLKQEIAEFLTQVIEIAARDRVNDFVGFLNGVGSNGREILLEIPGAAAVGRNAAMMSSKREISREEEVMRYQGLNGLSGLYAARRPPIPAKRSGGP
jgi:hypothetical protein